MIETLKQEYEAEIFDLEIEDGFLWIQNVKGCTDKDLLRLSTTMSDVIITAEITVKTNPNDFSYIVDYKNGNKHLQDVDINYKKTVVGENHIEILELLNTNTELRIKVNIALNKFFTKIDVIWNCETDEFMVSYNLDKTISVKMDVDNYSMIASKTGDSVIVRKFKQLE